MANPMPLQHGRFYHIYNRGINGENLFVEARNYSYFLQLYTHHLHPVVDTYAYCLLGNHFHLLIRVKTEQELADLSDDENLAEFDLAKPPSQYFSNLFNAYTKAINKMYRRTGALFERPFRRIEVGGREYFKRLVIYIHRNPEHHNFVDDFREWPYSSYDALRTTKPTKLQREIVLDWFDGSDIFVAGQQMTTTLPAPLALEDGF
ncbi:MAG: hypothetical protein RBT75_01400 [Anaerolineae bacterium]|jgi:hypothetical protein|nr:hypothetical protein [Anaerolineae bacterium]